MAESYITRKGGGGGVPKYTSWAVQATNGAKFESYNGYNFPNNATGNLSNITFNTWLLNNSTSRPIVLKNVTLGNTNSSGGLIGSAFGPEFVDNENFYESTQFWLSTVHTLNENQRALTIDKTNGHLYLTGQSTNNSNTFLTVINTSNLATIQRTQLTGVGSNGPILFNNGHFFLFTDGVVRKYNASTFSLQNTSVGVGSFITAAKINNGKIFVTRNHGGSNFPLYTFWESNLVSAGNSVNIGTRTVNGQGSMYIDGGKIFLLLDTGTFASAAVYNEDNLSFIQQLSMPPPYAVGGNGGKVFFSTRNQDDGSQRYIASFWVSNLASAGNSASYTSLTFESNGASAGINSSWSPVERREIMSDGTFIYVWFQLSLFRYLFKFRMSGLTYLTNTAPSGQSIFVNDPVLFQNSVFVGNTSTNGNIVKFGTTLRSYTIKQLFEIKNLSE